MAARVVLDTSPPGDAALIAQAAEGRYHKLHEVCVAPTMRLGNSKARTYRVRVRLENSRPTRFFYAKIGRRERMQSEFDAYSEYVRDQLPQTTEAWLHAPEGCSDSCLCCFSAGIEHAREPTPLVELLTDPFGLPAETICRALDRLFHTIFEPWRAASIESEVRWFADYEWYLRWDRTEPFLKQWLGPNAFNESRFSIGQSTLLSPVHAIHRLRDEDLISQVGRRPVHGDLHQRNIIVDELGTKLHPELNPWLIDFEWTRKFHSIVDYALLEASLKVFHFARFISEPRYLEIHDILHRNEDASSLHLSVAEKAMATVIAAIRRNAREEIKNEGAWPQEYYLSSLLVSIGILTTPTCPVRMAWLTGAWFASNLRH